jgi:hypothetical protein
MEAIVTTSKFTIASKNTSTFKHGIYVFRHWKQICVAFISSAGVLWSSIDMVSSILDINIKGYNSLIAILLISLAFSFFIVIYKYYFFVIPGFENEPPIAQKIAHLRKSHWEYNLILLLLKAKIIPYDNKLKGILKNSIHVPIKSELDIIEYYKWLKLRPINLRGLVKTITQLLIYDINNIVRDSKNDENTARNILECVNNISELYRQSLEFEIEGRSILPPPLFDKIHRLHLGWTESIRSGISQFNSEISKLANHKKKDGNSVVMQIVLESPSNMGEFQTELELIQASSELLTKIINKG